MLSQGKMEKNNIIRIYQLWESNNYDKDIRIILNEPLDNELDDLVRGVVILYEKELSDDDIRYAACHLVDRGNFVDRVNCDKNILSTKKLGNDYYLLMGDFLPFTSHLCFDTLNNIKLINDYLENEVNKKNFSKDLFSINEEEIDQLEKRVWPVLIKKNLGIGDLGNVEFTEIKGYLYIEDK